MERLTSAEVRVDASVDGMIGPLVDLTNLKPKLLNMILNGPTLNGVSKDMLRQIIRQLYSELAAYEDTGLEPNVCADYKAFEDEAISKGVPFKRIVELMEADKDGRLVALPCKVGDTVYLIVTKRAGIYAPEFRFIKKIKLTFLNMERILQDFGKTVFLTREEAEKALEATEDDWHGTQNFLRSAQPIRRAGADHDGL
jgi:hypothetical protein